MSSSNIYKIIAIKADSIIVQNNNGERFTIYYNQISMSNGSTASPSNIDMNDKIRVEYNGNILSSITLQKPIKDISEITDISLLNFNSKEKVNALSGIFGSYRKIRNGLSNIPLAFISALIDNCVIYKKNTIINIINILNEHEYQLIDHKPNLILLLESINLLIESSSNNSEKFAKLQQIYNENIETLEKLTRNLLKVSVEINYHKSQYLYLQALGSMAEMVESCRNGLFEFSLLFYLIDTLRIQLRIIDSCSLKISPQGYHPGINIYLLQTEVFDYYPIYTVEETYLQKASEIERMEIIKWLKSDEDMNHGNSKKRKAEFEKEISCNEEDAVKMLSILHQILGGLQEEYKPVDMLSGQRDGLSALNDYCCCVCSSLVKTVKLPCQHLICRFCVYDNSAHSYSNCSVCGVYFDKEKIYRLFLF